MDSSTVFSPAVNWGISISLQPEFYLLLAGIFSGAALAVLTLRGGATPKAREALGIRKGWLVPLLLAFAVGILTAGFFRIGVPPSLTGLWTGALVILAVSFFLFRFPRVLGLPVLAGLVLTAGFTGYNLWSWHGAAAGQSLAYLRPLGQNQWEIRRAGESAVKPAPELELRIIETPSWLGLTGNPWYYQWTQDVPQDTWFFQVFGALGLGERQKVSLPPVKAKFYPSTLILQPSGKAGWISGF